MNTSLTFITAWIWIKKNTSLLVATAKRHLSAGERLDGEGGYTLWGKLMPAPDSLALGGLPIGLAHGVKLVRDVPAAQPVRWSDVEILDTSGALQVRREMESTFRAAWNLPETLAEPVGRG